MDFSAALAAAETAHIQGDKLFEAGLKARLIKEGKIKIHQDVINRIIAGYRS